jgi:hypothetical protein
MLHLTLYRYRVRNWDGNFETAQSRKVDRPQWVGVPNKQHGLGLANILSLEDGAAIYGLWHLIVGACSQQRSPRAGWLTQDGTAAGVPWTIDDFATKWRRRPSEIARALDVLCSPKVGWVEVMEEVVDDSQKDTAPLGAVAHCPVQSSPGQAGRGAQVPQPGASPSRDDRRQQLRVRLARLRFASDDTALEEWAGLLTEDAKCRNTEECMECLQFIKVQARKEGLASRFAAHHERFAIQWRHARALRKSLNEVQNESTETTA